MAVHVIFIFIYLICKNIFYIDGTTINNLFVAQCVISIIFEIYNSKKFINPLTIMYISGILSSIGNNVIFRNINNPHSNLGYYVMPQYADEAAFIWAFGMTFIYLGYLIFRRYSLPSIRVDTSRRTANSIFIYLLLISFFSPEISGLTASLGSISRLIALVGSISILFYARLWAAEDSKKFRNYAFALLFVQTYVALTHSFLREELILPFIVMIAGYFTGKGNVKYIFSYRSVPILFVFYLFSLVFSSLGEHRSEGSSFFNTIKNEYFSEEKDKRMKEVFDQHEEKGSFIERSANIGQITNIIKLVKDNGYYDGDVSAPLVIALVPRIFWPEKPQIVIGMWFAGAIGQGTDLGHGKNSNSINLTIPGLVL